MSSMLMLDSERKELEQRLADFSLLEWALYPAIADVADGLGADCVVSLKHDKGTQCYDTFRVTALKDNKPQCFVDVKFASATATGDYKVSLVSSEGATIEHEMVGRPDLIDVIESFLASALKAPHESKDSGFLTAWQANAQDAASALEELLADKGLDARVEFVKDGNDSGTMSAAVVWCGNNRVASFEFEGARRYRIVWYVFGEEIDQGHIEGTVEETVKKYSDDIIDALEPCQD